MKLKRCRNCQSTKLTKLFSLGNMCFTGKFPNLNQVIKKKTILLVMCKNCKLVQLGHSFDLNYLYGPDYGYKTGINKTMLDHVKSVVKYLSKKAKLKKKEFVMDIASNDGSLLKNYNSNIVKCGVDPILKKYINEYRDVKFKIPSFFSSNKIKKHIKEKKFKIITALSVFYDAANPNKFLQDIKKLLHREGICLLEFADLASIIKFKMFDTICHEHLEYYSSNVVLDLCKKNGLKVFDIKKNDINGASKQYYICHADSKFLINSRIINKELLLEKKLNLTEVITFKKFIKEINISKKKLVQFLTRMQKFGKKIHCYGASTKGNVLLQYYGIDNKLIQYAAERNKFKYNLFTPGSKIKIISEKNSRMLKPDFYLVLPWHFKKEILLREKKIRKRGVKFIFPLPKLSII